jgi:hypothetical protein
MNDGEPGGRIGGGSGARRSVGTLVSLRCPGGRPAAVLGPEPNWSALAWAGINGSVVVWS